jgi:hypothetical protein
MVGAALRGTICGPSHFLLLLDLDLNSEIETADSADFTDFEEVIGEEARIFLRLKLQGIYNRDLMYLRYVICGKSVSVFGLR